MTWPAQDTAKETLLKYELLKEPMYSLAMEMERISAEIQSISSGFQAQMQQALEEAREALEEEYRLKIEQSVAGIRRQLQTEIADELRKEFESRLEEKMERLADLPAEIKRVAAQLERVESEIAAMLDDPSIELSKVMRKRSEQSDLKAYLAGLHFATGTKSCGRGLL